MSSWFVDLQGRPLEPQQAPPLRAIENTCGRKHYEFGCECSDCTAHASLIAERGFDEDGSVKPPPRVTQPWEARSRTRKAA